MTSGQLAIAASYLHTSYADSDIVRYYTYLASQGVTYGNLALGVVDDTGDGAIANAYAASVASNYGVDLSVGSADWKATVFNVASVDIAARTANSGADLTWQQYDTLHAASFNLLGLTPET